MSLDLRWQFPRIWGRVLIASCYMVACSMFCHLAPAAESESLVWDRFGQACVLYPGSLYAFILLLVWQHPMHHCCLQPSASYASDASYACPAGVSVVQRTMWQSTSLLMCPVAGLHDFEVYQRICTHFYKDKATVLPGLCSCVTYSMHSTPLRQVTGHHIVSVHVCDSKQAHSCIRGILEALITRVLVAAGLLLLDVIADSEIVGWVC